MQSAHRLVYALTLVGGIALVIVGWPQAAHEGALPAWWPSPESAPPLAASIQPRRTGDEENARGADPPAAEPQLGGREQREYVRTAAASLAAEPASDLDEAGDRAQPFAPALPGEQEGDEDEHPAIELSALEPAPGELSTWVRAVDHGSPRTLTLWRLAGDEATAIATARSRARGAAEFGPLLVPLRGLRVIATAEAREPDARDREDSLEILPALPAPRVEIEEAGTEEEGEEGLRIAVRPALSFGRIMLADADEAIFDLYDLDEAGSGQPGAPLQLVLSGFEGTLLVAHELPDGRSSDWRVVNLTRRSPAGLALEAELR